MILTHSSAVGPALGGLLVDVVHYEKAATVMFGIQLLMVDMHN